jgi:hypothetical protein
MPPRSLALSVTSLLWQRGGMAMLMSPEEVERFVIELLDPVFHKKLCISIAHAVTGLLASRSLTVADIGREMARARETSGKHGIKQVDRLLGNGKFDLDLGFRATVPRLLGERARIVVTLDWTEYGRDKQSRIALNLVSEHGRATPLMWRTVSDRHLKDRMREHELDLLWALWELVPEGVQVIVLADRGFGDASLYTTLSEELGFDYVIRFRDVIHVHRDGQEHAEQARDLIDDEGEPRLYRNVRVTHKKVPVPAIVTVWDLAMKSAWSLATSLGDAEAEEVVALYGRRFTCEENFRDEKDWRFGMAARHLTIKNPARRDRLLFVYMIATLIWTTLGAAGEELGLDRQLKANTVKRRTHSLLRQGRHYIRGVARKWRQKLRTLFFEWLDHIPKISETYGVI